MELAVSISRVPDQSHSLVVLVGKVIFEGVDDQVYQKGKPKSRADSTATTRRLGHELSLLTGVSEVSFPTNSMIRIVCRPGANTQMVARQAQRVARELPDPSRPVIKQDIKAGDDLSLVLETHEIVNGPVEERLPRAIIVGGLWIDLDDIKFADWNQQPF